MNIDITIFVSVTFFSHKRNYLPCLTNEKYCPHMVVKGDNEYLGVSFIDGDDSVFDTPINAAVLPIYEGVNYTKLNIDTCFFIMEGGKIVGDGTVVDVFYHNKLK